MQRLSVSDVEGLDPYVLMAVLGKRFVHPGGRHASTQLLTRAGIQPGEQVLDIGCGVATTAVQVARSHGAEVTAADISPIMQDLARTHVRAAGVERQVRVESADITALPYRDGQFDCVIAEAVTMFVDRRKAAGELIRVCRPGGTVLATEFLWRRPPSAQAREIFMGQVCPGMQFDTLEDWVSIYAAAGLTDLATETGPFEMMTARGFLADEGVAGTLAIMARVGSRLANIRKMGWLMPRMTKAVPFLGYVVVVGGKTR